MPANAGDVRDVGWIPGLGRSPGEGNDYLLQYPCLENPVDRRAWSTIVHGVTESDTIVLHTVRRWHPTPVLLPGKSHGQRSLVGCGPWGCEVGHD